MDAARDAPLTMVSLNEVGEVRAAGGIVIRDGERGPEVLIVHRPKYDDWTLPKGKAESGETDEECALREVEEETGYQCELGDELPSVRYVDRLGRPKVARYWRMRATDGTFSPHDEVDEIRWVALTEAAGVLTYERDAEAMRRLVGER